MKDNKMKLNIYDVVFVLPTVSITYPPGGYDIVYRLAQALNKESIRPSIIFLKKPKIYIENYIVSENVKNKNRLTRLMLSLFNLLPNIYPYFIHHVINSYYHSIIP
ncbi:hypothetical protein [Ferroplasma acidiphilum]|uniref:hypothetical protein n=1 Tax=Ferroplasma acidiphilum TaxID=74969 RepID=UPI0009BF757D|nr:hypothetical protein [Ferroplasma acidiphilum]